MSSAALVRCCLDTCFKRQRLHNIKSCARKANEIARQKFTTASCISISNVKPLHRGGQDFHDVPGRSHRKNLHFCSKSPRWCSFAFRGEDPRNCTLAQQLDTNVQSWSSEATHKFLTGSSPRRWQSTVLKQSEPSLAPRGNMNRAVIAFGSNIGDRISYIEDALVSMKAKGLDLLRLSRLYETAPMYYQNQNSFLNGVVLLETDLSPVSLLDMLQQIEIEQGRRREIEKGPRTLDLDIILYGEELIDIERLKIPHPGVLEREFVLRPLADVVPNHSLQPLSPISNGGGKIRVNSALTAITNPSEPMYPITHVAEQLPLLTTSHPRRRTHVMSVLNITPDSFSDGGSLSPDDLETLASTVRSHIASGATILDVGGQSTRPNAPYLTASEELSRVLPALRHIKQIPEAQTVAISLDTFHSEVARACTAEDLVDVINDVSAGLMDPNMLHTMAESRRCVVLMHMRGTPSTMNKLTDYPDGVVKGVADELSLRVTEALDAGIAPWRIVLDPGIGFAKTIEQNLELLRVGSDGIVKARPDALSGYPWLVGTSRKGFIGRITGVKEARERVWGTGACVTAAVAGGADIVRVHDVAEMKGLVAMADAIYRGYQDEKT